MELHHQATRSLKPLSVLLNLGWQSTELFFYKPLVGLEFELCDLLERLAAPVANQRLNGLLIETVAHGLECGPFALLVGSLSGYAAFLEEFDSGAEEPSRSLGLAARAKFAPSSYRLWRFATGARVMSDTPCVMRRPVGKGERFVAPRSRLVEAAMKRGAPRTQVCAPRRGRSCWSSNAHAVGRTSAPARRSGSVPRLALGRDIRTSSRDFP